jgi:hypothetical protein
MTTTPDTSDEQLLHLVKARGSVDNSQMRSFVVHLHRLLDPASSRAD